MKIAQVGRAIDLLAEALGNGRSVLVFGNGGSATQSSHFAAELVNKFYFRRRALPVLALNADMANVTSIANDEDFQFIFSRQVEAFGERGDVALGSPPAAGRPMCCKALAKAREKGMPTIALAGSQVREVLRDPRGRAGRRGGPGHADHPGNALVFAASMAETIEKKLFGGKHD